MHKSMVQGFLAADAQNITTAKGSFISMTVVNNDVPDKTKPEFITINANTNRYANLLQYLKKGKYVCVIGSETTSIFQDKDKNNKVDVRIFADCINFVSTGGQKPTENGEANANANATTAPATSDATQDMTMPPLKSKTKAEPAPAVAEANATNASDDLPF